MAYNDPKGAGYAKGTPNVSLSARDLGRAADGDGITPWVQEVTHEITANADLVKNLTAAGTREALAGSTPVRRAIITAHENNLGVVVVGGSTVVAALGTRPGTTRRGLPLNPGDSVSVEISNLANVYIDAVNSGDGVSVWYFT